MLLTKPIMIKHPPSSDSSGNVQHYTPYELKELHIIYEINDTDKQVSFFLPQIGQEVTVISSENYNSELVFNKDYLDYTFLQMLGDDPEKFINNLFPPTLEQNPNGPGTVLSKMIKSVGIQMSDSCSCKRHALQMNEHGNDWCEQNIDTIVGWLREEAKLRNLPFLDTVGKILVGRAIKKSRKLLANEPVPENDEDLDNNT